MPIGTAEKLLYFFLILVSFMCPEDFNRVGLFELKQYYHSGISEQKC